MTVLLALILATAAPTDDRVAHAKELFDAGNYAEAAAELELAYADDPKPSLLRAWGTAQYWAGDCDKAVELYRRFLDTDPPDSQREYVQAHIDACAERAPASAATPPPAEPEDEATLGPAHPPPPIPKPVTPLQAKPIDTGPAPRPWHRDVAGTVLVGTGSGLLAVGLGLAIAAEVHDGRANDAGTHGGFEEELDRAVAEARVAAVLIGVGAPVVLAGVIRYAVVAGRARKKRRARKTALTGQGISVRF